MKRRIGKASLILMSSVLLGILLLIIVFSLPVKSARAHVKESIYPMVDIKNDDLGDSNRKYILGLKENFTDCLMVQNALEKVEDRNLVEHAMYIYHYDLSDDTTWLTEESLMQFSEQGEKGMYLREYSKYWHGYLVWLKPLLMCMSWELAEVVWFVCQVLLLVFVVVFSFYKKQGGLGLGLLATLLFMKPVSIWISFAMCVCWGIVVFAVLGLLLWYQKLESKKEQENFFLLIGIMTAYMDFLTYPIATLGIPLCMYLVLNHEEHILWWKRVLKIFWIGVLWAVGYIGMWGMKWVCAELLCQSGTLRNAVWSVIYRTTPLDGHSSALSGISRTIAAVFSQYDSVLYDIGFVVIATTAVISVVLCFMKARNWDWGITIICLGIVALLPFAWLVVTQNHTAIHCFFTFRIMGVTICALWCMTICSLRTMKRKKSKHEN
jgi:hypothetical protein